MQYYNSFYSISPTNSTSCDGFLVNSTYPIISIIGLIVLDQQLV